MIELGLEPIMAEIVNLKNFKKQKARALKERTAADNRVKYGTPKHLRNQMKAQNLLEKKRLEGAKLKDE